MGCMGWADVVEAYPVTYPSTSRGLQGVRQRRVVAMAEAKKARRTSERKPLNTTDANSSLWLLKIPNHIAERWIDKDPNDILGRMQVTSVKDPSSSSGSTTFVRTISLLSPLFAIVLY